MLLFPAKTKFKKAHKRYKHLERSEFNYNQPLAGFFGLKTLFSFRITALQIEAVRKSVAKNLKKRFKNKLKITFFPDIPVTKKSSGIRMGKGKGNVDHWCFLIKKGRVLFELDAKAIDKAAAFHCFLLASRKLPSRFLPII